jgi:hypothetical protein
LYLLVFLGRNVAFSYVHFLVIISVDSISLGKLNSVWKCLKMYSRDNIVSGDLSYFVKKIFYL